jgi:hypothetical protein
MSNASPVPGYTCAAGTKQGSADFNSRGRLDQSISDKDGTIFQDLHQIIPVMCKSKLQNLYLIF